MSKEIVGSWIEKAAKAHTDLNTFHSLVAILEGGTVYTSTGQRTAARIIALCQRECQKQLKVYDRVLEEGKG